MKILAFDTSVSSLSIALLSDQKLLTKNTVSESGKQSELLICEIEKILKENKIWYQDLDLVATSNGPGSFTGVRVGLSAARILKIAANLPLVLVNSCEVVAYKYRNFSGKIFVALDAKIDEFFCAKFVGENGKVKAASNLELVRFEDVKEFFNEDDFLLCGSGKKIIKESLKSKFEMSDEEDFIEAELIGMLAYEKFQVEGESKNLNPVYLREPKIEKRKK
jgi:tRNA threonylcarbamoyladenosine biosynthesis protein TsaB